jgi:hypothetical protein
MSFSIGAVASARASYDDGNWCGTKPGPRPHFDLGSILGIGGGIGVQGDEQCGNGIRKLNLPPPPPPTLGEAAGALGHMVQLALGR